MKVIAINGSPHPEGNTYQSLRRVCEELEKENIETEIITIGNRNICGCKACGACSKLGKCAFGDADGLNEIGEKMAAADGILIGSPVYYAGINGTLKSFLDRVFYTYGGKFRMKPAAAVVALRRGGAIAAYDTINHYFGITEMMMVPSMYWNAVHGAAQGECQQDAEGMQLMEAIGRNMAYLLKVQAASNIPVPEKLQKIKYNYVR